MHFTQNITCQYYVYVWLIINLLPSKVSVFVTSRAANSYNLYSKLQKKYVFDARIAVKGPIFFGKKAAFWVLNTVATL